MLESGQVVCEGRFRIEDVLGKGGAGTVYRARDLSAERAVALKVVTLQDSSERSVERFRREGEITAALRHPAIVTVHEFGQERDYAWLAYELVEGARTLQDVREEPLRERVELLASAAEAIGYAHAQGVVHRDLKPANILLTPAGLVRVADFGLAAAAGLSRLTETGTLVGTPHYMAPEQFQGKRGEVGPHSDVWALGVILYEVLAGQLPFDAPTFWELAAQINARRPPRPSTLAQGLRAELEDVCFRALSRRPEERYPDGRAFAADLRSWLNGERVSARRRAPSGARWALLSMALLPLVGAAVAAGTLASPPPAPPVEAPGAVPLERPATTGWSPQVGDVRTVRLRFEGERLRLSVSKKRLVEFVIEERIEEVEGSVVSIAGTLRAVKIEFGLLRFDSREPQLGAKQIQVDGTLLSYRVDLATGEVHSLEGLDLLGGEGLVRLAGAAAEHVSDLQLQRHQRALLAVLPPRGYEAAGEWQRRLELWPEPRLGIEAFCRFGREGAEVTLSGEETSVLQTPSLTRVFGVKLRGGARYDRSGWPLTWLRVEFVQQKAEDSVDVWWQLTSEELPVPEGGRSE